MLMIAFKRNQNFGKWFSNQKNFTSQTNFNMTLFRCLQTPNTVQSTIITQRKVTWLCNDILSQENKNLYETGPPTGILPGGTENHSGALAEKVFSKKRRFL